MGSNFGNMNIRGKKNRISKESALTEEELYKLFNETNGIDKVLVAGCGFFGMRESEVIHMVKDWLHIGDSDAKFLHGDHIGITH